MPWPQICPDILASGACPYGARCTYNHTVLSCEPCGFVARSQYDYRQHIDSRHHRSRASQSGRGRALSSYCGICQEDVPERTWERHLGWPKHRQREASAKHHSVLDEAEKDKNGVFIEGVTNLGFIDPLDMPPRWNGHRETLAAKVGGPPGTRIRLVEVGLASKAGSRPFNSGFTITSAGLGMITPNAPALVAFRFTECSIGRYDDRIEFTFEEPRYDTSRRFIISRTLQVIVGSLADHEALRPREPYGAPHSKYPDAREPGDVRMASGSVDVVPGVPPPSVQAVKYVAPLPRAEIPVRLLDVFEGFSTGMSLRSQIAASRAFLPGILTNVTYVRHFKYLLWVEEHRTEADLARYDMNDVTLSKFNNYYYLGIPGLAEKRPSVLVGDRILFQPHGVPSSQWYEGHVHIVRQNEVGLCFHASFAAGGWSPTQRYSVRFKLSRIVLRRQHQALDSALFDSALDNDRLFFPVMEHTMEGSGFATKPPSRTSFFNALIANNPEQSEAVSEIVALPPGSVPFIIWGPPGTGKTVTVVEAILQVLQGNPNARILACAPSNSAADLIAERLSSTLSPHELFRMYAPSRSKESVSHRLSSYAFQAPETQTNYTHCYGVPPMPQLQSYKVVVSTFVSSSMLSGVGMPRGHFHWVFVDEAGHATEPEACIPLKTLADDKTNVVLSGDPKQLGPIVRSAVARTLGLEKSFLERLMEREVYLTDPGQARKCIVKLTQNFRSHPSILKFPNDTFYGGDLLAFGPTAVTHAYLNSPFLPRPAASNFPVVFHSVVGKDEREASSPSFFNVDEVLQVKKYVQKLKDGRGQFRTTDADIGIIAPYHAQCLKLRAGMRNVADTVKVGSVEEFQGQERKVIIISTVRSSKEFVSFDLRHTLGFVANPRRFNVAVTRAKALLIVVGNPHVLGLDPLWRAFLQYIYLNGGWTGSSGIPWDLKEEDGTAGEEYGARVRRQAEMDMSELARKVQASMDEGEEGDVNVDRPWKDDE